MKIHLLKKFKKIFQILLKEGPWGPKQPRTYVDLYSDIFLGGVEVLATWKLTGESSMQLKLGNFSIEIDNSL